MDLKEFVSKLGAKPIDDDGTFSYLVDKLGGKIENFYYSNEDEFIEAVTVLINNKVFYIYRNFIPLWRFIDITQCFSCNWSDMFPGKIFFMLPGEDLPQKK